MLQMLGEGRTAQVFQWGEERVLKLFYDWASPDWVESEFRSARLAYEASLPVPQAYEIIRRDGRSGILYERIRGESGVSIFRRQPWRVPQLVGEMAALQVRVLMVQARELPPVKAQLAHAIRRATGAGLDAGCVEEILRRLETLPNGTALCHMDFHPDNVLWTERGPVLIDWMNASSGHPLADVARSTIIYTVAGAPPGVTGGWQMNLATRAIGWTYRRAIRSYLGDQLAQLPAWMLPVAAARVVENAAGERNHLLALIRRWLNG